MLQRALGAADPHTASWIIRTILKECRDEGLAYVQELAAGTNAFSDLAHMLLVFTGEITDLSLSGLDAPPDVVYPGDDKHSEYVHSTFADYAVSKAKTAGLPIEGSLEDELGARGLPWQRLHEGAEQEDQSFVSVSGEVIRQREHAYNPMTNKGFNVVNIQFGTVRERVFSIWNDSLTGAFIAGDLYTEEIGSAGKLGGACSYWAAFHIFLKI